MDLRQIFLIFKVNLKSRNWDECMYVPAESYFLSEPITQAVRCGLLKIFELKLNIQYEMFLAIKHYKFQYYIFSISSLIVIKGPFTVP